MSKQYLISDYYPHPNQLLLHQAQEKEVVVISSIRAGKSYALIHEIIKSAWNNKTPFGLLVASPVYKLTEAVLERPIVSKLEAMGLLSSHSFSRHESVLKNGNIIYYRSLEEPDNALRGLNIFKAVVDEATYCSKYSIDVVKGRLLTTNGQLILVGTPAGLSSWLYEDYFAKEKKPGVNYIKFNLLDNPIITPEAVERLKQSYDPLLYKQEVLGEWVSLYSNQVYHAFNDDNIKEIKDVVSAVYVGLDFNIDINAWVAVKKLSNNTFYVFKEGYGSRTTADVARQILSEFGSQAIVVPDATGGNRLQGTAITNFQLLKQAGIHNLVENRSNPTIEKRCAVLNATLRNALNQIRLFIDPSCTRLIRELRELSYKENSAKIDEKNGKVGHLTSALGYSIYHLTGASVGSIITPSEDFISNFKKRSLNSGLL